MFRCPKCNAALSVSIMPDTNYDQVKAETEITDVDRFAKIQLWRKSLKRANLETIMISEESLRDPLVQELFDRLKSVGSMKSVDCEYKLSVFNNRNFLQRWTK